MSVQRPVFASPVNGVSHGRWVLFECPGMLAEDFSAPIQLSAPAYLAWGMHGGGQMGH